MPQSPLTGQFLKKIRHIGFGVFIVYSFMDSTYGYWGRRQPANTDTQKKTGIQGWKLMKRLNWNIEVNQA